MATVELHDPRAPRSRHGPTFQNEYVPPTVASITGFGGKLLVAGGEAETLEGSDFCSRTVVFEFADLDTALAWYRSPGYAPLIQVRKTCAPGHLVIISGD